MAEEELIGHQYTERLTIRAVEPEIRFKFKGKVHLRNLYIMLHNYLIDEEWVTRKDVEWPEHYYLQREEPSGNVMWIWWRLKKVPEKNKYYRYLFDVFWFGAAIKDVEVMHQGKKFKTNNVGDLEIIIHAYVEMDYMHEVGQGWRDHWLLSSFHDLFRKRIIKQQLEKHKYILHRDAYRMQDVIKRYLGLKTFMPEPEGQRFWPQGGIGDLEGITPNNK